MFELLSHITKTIIARPRMSFVNEDQKKMFFRLLNSLSGANTSSLYGMMIFRIQFLSILNRKRHPCPKQSLLRNSKKWRASMWLSLIWHEPMQWLPLKINFKISISCLSIKFDLCSHDISSIYWLKIFTFALWDRAFNAQIFYASLNILMLHQKNNRNQCRRSKQKRINCCHYSCSCFILT